MDACRSRWIVGSAIVTTRLSRVVMKSAMLVIANVQSVRFRSVVTSPSLSCCRWCSLVVSAYEVRSRKKGSGVVGIDGPELAQAVRHPGIAQAAQIHRGDHVQEHSLGEEQPHILRRRAGGALDPLPQIPITAPDDGAHLGVGAVGV